MARYTIRIDKEYFVGLGKCFNNVFENVNDAISYAKKTSGLDHKSDKFSKWSKSIKSLQKKISKDVDCIASVFSDADNKQKKRAEEIVGPKIINTVSGGETVDVDCSDMMPVSDKPRQISKTQYGYYTDKDGNQVYDHPLELDGCLYREQGSAYPDEYLGTCGVCACVNILRMAGMNVSERELLDYAIEHGLCDTGGANTRYYNGGTTPQQRAQLLRAFGLDCYLEPVITGPNKALDLYLNELDNNVSEGRGVIISVYSDRFYNDSRYAGGTHAVVVTSIKKDSNGNVIGCYVCDSNGGQPIYYDSDHMLRSMNLSSMVVTKNPIR